MARSIDESNSNPTIPIWIKIPTIDELTRPSQPPPGWQLLPPPARPKNDPFGPVPIIPPPPHDVDSPSRPPEWMFGPPYISNAPMPVPSSGSSYTQFALPDAERITMLKGGVFGAGTAPEPFIAAPAQEKPGGLLGMMAKAGFIDPSNPDRPQPRGLLGLIQDYLRNN